jgi:hypothetical protein
LAERCRKHYTHVSDSLDFSCSSLCNQLLKLQENSYRPKLQCNNHLSLQLGPVLEKTKHSPFPTGRICSRTAGLSHAVNKSDADKIASREQICPVEDGLCMSFQAHQVTIP